MQPTTRYHGQVPAFLAEVRGRVAAGEQVLIAAASGGELERLSDLCREYDVPYRLGEFDQSPSRADIVEESVSGGSAAVLVRAPLPEGFVIPDLRFAFYGNSDLFETLPVAARVRPRSKTASFMSDLSELKPGDYVVHVDHGIGQFQGLQTLGTDGRSDEFMRLRYADDARLYVPMERMDLVQSYHSLSEATADSGSAWEATTWTTRKSKVKKSLTDLADKLLELYAERKAIPGFAYSADTPWQREFEDAFGFSETPDQATAIADIKRDMERPQPMDRLLCGDVGYGKTEVAMRAAFKALADSKQVALLAPTTVLVFQHCQTFRQRMGAFPVRIEMLSRFQSAREQKKIIAEIEAGKVDVVIGTHRLLSKDVRFHDLGLLDCGRGAALRRVAQRAAEGNES